MKRFLLLFIILTQSSILIFAFQRNNLDRPLMFGPQYPLMYFTTYFVPDSAFTLPPGDFYFQLTYMENNAFAYTSDAEKYTNSKATPGEFTGESSEGYSVYIDTEIHRRIIRTQLGISDSVEFQFVFRDIKIGTGGWDSTIENFHNNFGLGNQNREYATQDELHIYIRNNETGENEYVITEKMTKFRKEAITVALKFSLSESEDEALSLTFASSYGDYLLKDLNEVNTDNKDDHKNFDDYTISLNYSAIFENWSVYAALSRSQIKNALFENTEKHVNYSFLGLSWHVVETWDILLQTLQYSSIYPNDSQSSIGNDIIEICVGLRTYFSEGAGLEFGFTENFTQGAQNTDIIFFSSLMATF